MRGCIAILWKAFLHSALLSQSQFFCIFRIYLVQKFMTILHQIVSTFKTKGLRNLRYQCENSFQNFYRSLALAEVEKVNYNEILLSEQLVN